MTAFEKRNDDKNVPWNHQWINAKLLSDSLKKMNGNQQSIAMMLWKDVNLEKKRVWKEKFLFFSFSHDVT